MKIITGAFCAAATLALLSAPALAANPPKFNAICPGGIEVSSNGNGRVRINGEKANVKAVSASAWKAKHKGVSIDIGQDGAQVFVSSAADVCDIVSSNAAPNKDGSVGGVPAKDQEACLAAVSNTTNNGTVEVGEARSSEANNEVIVLVGDQKARWQCLVKNGRVAGVMSLTDEGSL